ncbi:MAG TPA: ankyrin repeat domain-containing protein, partial [Gemmataceae bacterium]|nr:ankyrin repeat domain-containing protein [Gemmataceae bacterium]
LFVLVIGFGGVWLFGTPTSVSQHATARNPAEQAMLDQTLLVAIRDGDKTQVQQLLQNGANANARDEAGDTALMRAALDADVEMMRVLVEGGAEVHVRGQNATAPLLRTTHDLDKMRLLLDRGAPVDDFVMVAAASVPGSRSALELLLAHGGNGRAAVPAYTALMAAAGTGDLEAVSCLLDHGANVKAKTPTGFTALIGAALSGNAKVVALLLERGADPNAVCELERGILQTPAGVAASMGHADCLRLLMAAGVDVNVQGGPFNHNALLGAATTPSKETVHMLLAKANVNSKDWNGNTALDWAARGGETDIVKMLRKAGAEQSKPPSHSDKPLALQGPPDADSARRAVSAALPLLQQSEQKITQTRNCVSCHQHPLVAMTVGLARKHGFKVDEKIASEERAHILNDMSGKVRPLTLGTGIDPTLSVHVLAGLAAEDEPSSRITDALVHYLVLRQRKNGRWQQENNRPPDEASDFQFTALAVRGLQTYAPKGRSREIAVRIDQARRWLQGTEPTDTADRVFQLLGLGWAKAEPESITHAVTNLAGEQREDGGWAQLPTLASDAYATGLALYALHEGGGVAVDRPAYRRGVEFLLRTQLADGSWFVASRSFPIVEYSSSGFPHGRSQFISAAATCWATMALTLTTPGPSNP